MLQTLESVEGARLVLLVFFGAIGVVLLRNAIDEIGYGLAGLAFGCYLFLLWIALHAQPS